MGFFVGAFLDIDLSSSLTVISAPNHIQCGVNAKLLIIDSPNNAQRAVLSVAIGKSFIFCTTLEP